ncbi:leucine-rich repeat domain-containing protein [Clostridium sp. PL3]|uniref:Leucine-rich repeat domain-containing protein n=1 Tax=Clostridium thailandense TaxID=2794346 RepID=A0A949TUS6_9CLOT|nr:leucine-rich repeat domain-containing protein [Clostridium thailandense]MBV7273866.1 leucine-rich repeat domain-containing protein [Clostridium thailandense]
MLKNKYNYMICVFCACLFLFFSYNVYASDDSKPKVDRYKTWTIIFNQPIDVTKLTKDSIQVKDKNNNLINVGLRRWPNTCTVLVSPPEKGYDLGEEYTLVITKQVYSEENKQIKEGKSFNFKIKETSEEPIVFKDSAFERLVRDKVDKPEWEPLYKSDVENITELMEQNCGRKDNNTIKDISGIENLVNLKSFILTYSQIEDISPLKNLTNLQTLWLYDDNITDISPLKGLINLKELELYGNQIVDIPSLKGLTNLEDINLGNNKIHDITLLKELPNLQSLNLVYNNITDISSLKGLSNLKDLNLGSNKIADISPLKGLINLNSLSLDDNNITDISSIKSLTNLDSLILDGNNITDISLLKGLPNLRELNLGNNKIADINQLKELTNLTGLWLQDNPINREFKEILKKYLPKCNIEFLIKQNN